MIRVQLTVNHLELVVAFKVGVERDSHPVPPPRGTMSSDVMVCGRDECPWSLTEVTCEGVGVAIRGLTES